MADDSVELITPEQAAERAIGWDQAIEAISRLVTPYLVKQIKENPYRKEE